jgi:hypothetical protein
METNPGTAPVDLGTVAKPEKADLTDVAVDIAKDEKKAMTKKPAKKATKKIAAKPAKKVAAKKAAKPEKKARKSKAGHKAQGQVSMECFKLLQARAKKDGIREAEVVRLAVEKFLGYKPAKE